MQGIRNLRVGMDKLFDFLKVLQFFFKERNLRWIEFLVTFLIALVILNVKRIKIKDKDYIG